EEIPTLLPQGTKLKNQPKTDEFDNSSNVVQNPGWKKWLFGGIVATAAIGTALALGKGKIKFPASLKNAGTTILNYIKKPFVWIINKFKNTP
ncbi:MAG: hypothetical protein K2F57_02720, partial [Candidatus Gastranaerophilales bacterium]|nr:hypothetical protein [Candidatus Gastranaerophilales bacterium]